MSASTTTDNKSEIECDDDEKETRVGVITPFRDSPEECARFVRLVDKVYSVLVDKVPNHLRFHADCLSTN